MQVKVHVCVYVCVQALGVLARPSHLPTAAELIYRLVDDMWACVGDRATDTSWYTKRATLAG